MLRDIKTKKDLAAALDWDTASPEWAVTSNRYRSVTAFHRGKLREMWEPNEELKRIQGRLKFLLEDEYDPTPSAHGYIRGRSTITNARSHLGCNFLLNFDFRNFFGSVTRRQVYDLLSPQRKIVSTVASAIADVVLWEDCLPMGAPTSPVLANMLLAQFDMRMTALCWRLGCIYTRYCDDCTISTVLDAFPREFASRVGGGVVIGDMLQREIGRSGFSLNDAKTRLADRHGRMEVTGIRVRDRLSPPRRYIRKLSSQLREWEYRGLEGASDRFKERGYSRKDYAKIVFGRVQYVGAVCGRDDPLYLQLRYRYNRLQAS